MRLSGTVRTEGLNLDPRGFERGAHRSRDFDRVRVVPVKAQRLGDDRNRRTVSGREPSLCRQRNRLGRRIRPFLLRRTKDQVVADLPEKTEVTRTIMLEGRQRDLYETLRASYAEEIRGYIAAQTFERNRIRMLEGLMRLRQVLSLIHI